MHEIKINVIQVIVKVSPIKHKHTNPGFINSHVHTLGSYTRYNTWQHLGLISTHIHIILIILVSLPFGSPRSESTVPSI